MKNIYHYQPETLAAIDRLYTIAANTVAMDDMQFGFATNEPLLVMLDSAIRYARAYQTYYGSTLNTDYVLGPAFLSSVDNIRTLLNSIGGSGMETRGRGSFDGGTLDGLACKALELAGYNEGDY